MSTIRVLIVDDAVVVRNRLSKILAQDSELEVVGVAATGTIALAKITQVNPDVVILDVEMPELNGLETLAILRQRYPKLPVIMFSAITRRGAAATLDALALGANDYATKPAQLTDLEAVTRHVQAELIPKIKVFGRSRSPVTTPLAARVTVHPTPAHPTPEQVLPGVDANGGNTTGGNTTIAAGPTAGITTIAKGGYPLGGVRSGPRPPEVLAIGASTGGPQALAIVLSGLPKDYPLPIVIVQHMPATFTQLLAERLSVHSGLTVAEAKPGVMLKPGQAWLAPGDYHLVVRKVGTQVRLDTHQQPPVNSCRPSVDTLFYSLAEVYGPATLAIVLTGMGQDGLAGCRQLRQVGGQILVQDRPSSVVWGMPGFVANAGLADQVLPLDQMAEAIWQRTRSN